MRFVNLDRFLTRYSAFESFLVAACSMLRLTFRGTKLLCQLDRGSLLLELISPNNMYLHTFFCFNVFWPLWQFSRDKAIDVPIQNDFSNALVKNYFGCASKLMSIRRFWRRFSPEFRPHFPLLNTVFKACSIFFSCNILPFHRLSSRFLRWSISGWFASVHDCIIYRFPFFPSTPWPSLINLITTKTERNTNAHAKTILSSWNNHYSVIWHRIKLRSRMQS